MRLGLLRRRDPRSPAELFEAVKDAHEKFDSDVECERLRLALLRQMDVSMEANLAAERALNDGKDADCEEVKRFQEESHKVNELLADWTAAGGLETL